MYPYLSDLLGFDPVPGVKIDTHSFFVALGLAVGALIFYLEGRRRRSLTPKTGYLVMGALVGAALLGRMGTWAQHLDPRENLNAFEQAMYGNASILSALVGAWLGVHVVKRVIGYRERSGDIFAPAVALAMAVGRWGCHFTEKPGTPTGGQWGIVLSPEQAARVGSPAGVGLHPSLLYESFFHLAAFCALWFWLRHKPLAPGETLTLYIAAYGVFRFFVEFCRGNEIAWMGLTRPQMFLLVTLPIIFTRIVLLIRAGKIRLHAPELTQEATA